MTYQKKNENNFTFNLKLFAYSMEKGYLCISIILKTSSSIDKIIIMGKRIKKLKKIHIHREGIDQLVGGFV